MARGSNIQTYTAPDRQLRPDNKGFAAFETAGRRIGPLYNQAGQDYREIGRLQARTIQGGRWPLNIMALRDGAKPGGAGGGKSRSGGGSGAPSHRAVNEMAAGMGALGNYLSASDISGNDPTFWTPPQIKYRTETLTKHPYGLSDAELQRLTDYEKEFEPSKGLPDIGSEEYDLQRGQFDTMTDKLTEPTTWERMQAQASSDFERLKGWLGFGGGETGGDYSDEE